MSSLSSFIKVQSPARTLNRRRILGKTLEYPDNKLRIEKIDVRSEVLTKFSHAVCYDIS